MNKEWNNLHPRALAARELPQSGPAEGSSAPPRRIDAVVPALAQPLATSTSLICTTGA